MRGYNNYTYELIYTHGKFKKKRVHLLINPQKNIKIKGQGNENDTVVNAQSLTHLVAIETSISNTDLIKNCIRFAELTNKPIITNQITANKFKAKGLSPRQLRIVGYDEEVINDISLDPIYLEEIPVALKQKEETDSVGSFVDNLTKKTIHILNPLNWKPIKKIKSTVINGTDDFKINPENPLAILIKFNNKKSVLLPLDQRGIENINDIIITEKPDFLVLIHQTTSDTVNIKRGVRTVIILNEEHTHEDPITISKIDNPGIDHDSILAGFEKWITIIDN